MKKLKDLGTVAGDPCSHALNINLQGQVVGNSSDCVTPHHAFLWEKGQMVDLNKLVQSKSGLQLADALNINERGEIAGLGLPPGCGDPFVCGHAFLLIPCDHNHDGSGNCEDNSGGTTTTAQSSSEPVTQNPK
jgi:probable HAF family extracellular repeat protein